MYEVLLKVGVMTLSATKAQTYQEAQEIKAKLEKEYSVPLITDGPGLEVKIKEKENKK